MPLTLEAKAQLARTIRGTQASGDGSLRKRLVSGIAAAAEGYYRLGAGVREARLDDVRRKKRERLEAWLDERARASGATGRELKAARDRALSEAVKLAGATFLNRVVLLRQLEAFGLQKPPVVTGAWTSAGYRAFRDFAPALCTDETDGYGALLALVFDELAVDLPGVFGDVGVTRLLPVPPAVVREALERLDDPGLASAWDDPTTLGWVYQYWNDPDREALDDKLNGGGKIEQHEIASKTQMFTERYMVEWLLQNSLGLLWLAICKKNGWAPEAERVLPVLENRRKEWRGRRERGEVPLDALMPVQDGLEERWKWFVPQPLPDDAVAQAPASIREVKLLDPACGSGHFLVIAFDLLAALYREEARHRGEQATERAIAERILEENLFGIDIDPRAVQIAAAALYLRARTFAPDARPRHVNLVAPQLQLADLPATDPALQRLKREVREETGLPEALTERIVKALAGVDHLGTLLKVDAAVDDAIREHELGIARDVQLTLAGTQATAEGRSGDGAASRVVARRELKSNVLEKLEAFLSHHASEEDLGLRLDGEQLAAGVRFIRMVKESAYDVVVGNPPYQGTSKLKAAGYVAQHYRRGKADLYTAFLERALELVKPGGFSGLLTMRGWMFLSQFEDIRVHLLRSFDLRTLADVDRGAFEDVANEVLACTMSVFRRALPTPDSSVALQPSPINDLSYDRERTKRKRAALLVQVGRYEFHPGAFDVIAGQPLVYWWGAEFLNEYAAAPKVGEKHPARQGLGTRNDVRFLRRWWEVQRRRFYAGDERSEDYAWAPYIKGAAGRVWFEPFDDLVKWALAGFELNVWIEHYRIRAPGGFIKNQHLYFRKGVAFTTIGASFTARVHRFPSIFGEAGSSVFPDDVAPVVCMMNSAKGRFVLESLNPTINFKNNDVDRLPILAISGAGEIVGSLEAAFTAHESARESSVEFKRPGPSPWRYAQSWAQRAVDRPAGEQLAPYEPECDPPRPVDFVSFAVGVALGRFGLNGAGLLDEAPATALPNGILYVSATERDSLDHPACAPLRAAWDEHRAVVGEGDDLRTWLRKKFFAYHKGVYENRPIYFPLSSERKSFVGWVSIHRWTATTLNDLLAEHLEPERIALAGELEDLRAARAQAGAGRGRVETRYARVQQLAEELDAFIARVRACAGEGPPLAEDGEPRREQDARFEMDLDDGVMVNAAGLWPLLDPQWNAPRKWWHELAVAEGRKDYDWSHLAARYFPARVAQKCEEDPSLAVAHGCFWCFHPSKAYAWELRLQDEIRPRFTIDEADSNEQRRRLLSEHAEEARELEAKEVRRRAHRDRRAAGDEQAALTFDADEQQDNATAGGEERAEATTAAQEEPRRRRARPRRASRA